MMHVVRAAVIAAVSLAVSVEARAEFPSHALYVGAYGGGTVVLRDWDLGDAGKLPRVTPDSSGMLGARVGYHLLPQLAIELELAYLPLRTSSGNISSALGYNLDLLIHILRYNWSPVVEAGIGGYHSVGGDLGGDFDPRFHVGVGVRGLVTRWLAVRLDLREVVSDGFDRWGAHNLELTAGLDFFVWRAKLAPPDRDKDGVPDASDECPDTFGSAATRGCPDADHDGVADKDDHCPNEAGPRRTHGCPDADSDGIIDSEDKCPNQPGPEKTQGCPDSDGDGIIDSEDKCPNQPGPRKTQGCPDADSDGIADADDRCPQQAGPAKFKGCPDRDGDGIPDVDDRCPDVPGIKEKDGCMPDVKKFAGAVKGITFATGSAKILRPSFKILDEAVVVMKEYPSLKLSIEGHTDNVGKPARNQALSQSRAEAVRDYLVGKGIEGGRIDAKGFGDTQPVQDNKKARGRAANRRIEFKISAQ
jgi:outer membrane protein OmpA-like peptidoglycan-associated protein